MQVGLTASTVRLKLLAQRYGENGEVTPTPKQRSCFLGFHRCNFSNSFVKDLFCPLGEYQLGKTWRTLTSYSQKRQGDEEIYTPVHARCQSHGPSSDPTGENFTQDQPGH